MGTDWTAFSRRHFLLASGCTLVGGLALPPLGSPLKGQEPISSSLGDAHVHFFNMSDLPAEGFFRHVVLPNNFADWEGLWPALLHLVGKLKPHAITAAAEDLRPWRPTPLDEIDRDISGLQFGLWVAGFLAQIAAFSRTNPSLFAADPGGAGAAEGPDAETAFSAELLARTINAVDPARRPPPGARFFSRAPNAIEFRRRATIDPYVIEAIVEDRISDDEIARADARLAADPDEHLLAGRSGPAPCPQAPSPGPRPNRISMLFSQLKWTHLMMQSRQYHLSRYVRAMRDGALRPRLATNLLVDYDRWLGDAPERASGHDAQIALWTKLAKRHSEAIDIRTFAGFDPLKDAEEFIKLGANYPSQSQLTRYLAYWRNRASTSASDPVIHGFKLYPPMGFMPLGNTPEMLGGANERAVHEIRKIWSQPPLNAFQVSAEIEKSLLRFYALCDAENIPLLAHAGHGNEAGRCFGERANPAGWLSVLRRFPNLRLCIGHFAEAVDFEIGMRHIEHPDQAPANAWAIRGTRELLGLNSATSSRAYCDIGYMSEFLVGSAGERLARATNFFRLLKVYCDQFDPGCRHLMYGSDWIMLGQVPKHDRYVETIRAGVSAAGWSEAWKANFFEGNLRRFLNG